MILTLVTLYFYYPFWFILRRKELNRLHSAEKVGIAGPFLGLGLWILVWILELVVPFVASDIDGPGAWKTASRAGEMSNIMSLAFGITMLVLSFKVRRILLDHSESQRKGMFAGNLVMDQQSSFSSVATFFFGIWYLQYKINRFVEEWRQQPRGPASDTISQPF